MMHFFHLSGNPKNHSCVLFIEFKLERCHCERPQEPRPTARRTRPCFSLHNRSQVTWQSVGCLHCLCFCFLAFMSSGSTPPHTFFFLITQSWILRSLIGVMKLWHTCSLPCMALHFLSKVLVCRKWSIEFVSIWQLSAYTLVFTHFKKKINICVVLWNFLKHFTSISFDL